MTRDELLDLLTEMLEGVTRKSAAHWRALLGPVTVHPLATHPRCNWSIAPTGKVSEVETAMKAIAVVREHHPYVD